jgi:small subunit ribosomal protein S20
VLSPVTSIREAKSTPIGAFLLPNKKSAIKRVQVAERNRSHNHAYKSAVRTAIKKARTLITTSSADQEAVQTSVRAAQSLLDRAVLKGMLSKNKASRDKSRLALAVLKQQG